MQSRETVIHPENLKFCTPTHPFSLPSAEAPTRGSEPENQPTNPSCLYQPPAHDLLSVQALNFDIVAYSSARVYTRMLSVAVFLAELSTVATKYQLTHVCIFCTACFPRQCMDSLQEIYIEDLPTGSRSKNSSIEEFFVPAQRPPLGSTEELIDRACGMRHAGCRRRRAIADGLLQLYVHGNCTAVVRAVCVIQYSVLYRMHDESNRPRSLCFRRAICMHVIL